jgi:hypothetical protein
MKGTDLMTFRPYLVIAATVVLCAPAAALAASQSTGHDSSSVNCGGSGVDALYCIPQQSVFTFTRVAKAPHCSIQVDFTVEPKIEGLKGRAHITLKGTGGEDRSISRTARPLVEGGPYSHKFTKLIAGPYQLTGWYGGDATRLASAHRTKRLTLNCG